MDPPIVTIRFWIKGGQLDPPVSDVTVMDQRRSARPPVGETELSATGAKRDVENIPKLYSGPTIHSWPCQTQAGSGLVFKTNDTFLRSS